MKRWIVAVVLSVAAASASPQVAPAGGGTPDRFRGNAGDPDYRMCLDLLREPDAPMQTACYGTGSVTRFGEVLGTKATCENAGINERVAKRMRGLTLLSPYLGYEGPVCMELLVDTRAGPSGSLKPDELLRRFNLKEVYPCEGREAPPKPTVRTTFAPGADGKPPMFSEIMGGSCLDAGRAAKTKAICIARAGLDASGRANVAPQAVCSNPNMINEAMQCVKSHRLDRTFKGERPGRALPAYSVLRAGGAVPHPT